MNNGEMRARVKNVPGADAYLTSILERVDLNWAENTTLTSEQLIAALGLITEGVYKEPYRKVYFTLKEACIALNVPVPA